ncbi:MAG: hypothetical protein HYS12_09515 [Planctomycetes bacterium]|nr:hypothetical protein [Planctomycetota bacterium]
MFSTGTRSGGPALGLLALLTVALAPSASPAQAVYFRNETQMTLTVYASCVFRGVVLRATPVQLQPKMSSPALKLPGTKLIVIQDARFPGRALYQDTIPASDDDRSFAIQPDLPAPRVRLQRLSPPPAKPGP